MMDRRIVSLLLCLTLVLSVVPFMSAAAAEEVGLNPPPEWWGMSRTAFTSAYKDEQFTEIEVDKTKALVLPGIEFTGDLTLDMVFRFAEKEAGKSWYGLSEIVYLTPLTGKKFTDSQLKTYFKDLQKILVNQNGKASKTGTDEAVWELDDVTVTLAVKAYRKLNGSSNKTVGVTYTRGAAAADTEKTKTSAGTRSARGVKSGALKAAVQVTCNDYNHVGDKWTYAYYVNGTKVTDGKSFTFNVGDEVAFKAVITEEDSTPDVGENTVTRVITEKDLQEGFKQRFTVSVTENGGRYNGSTARFTVTFSFTK